MKCIPVSKKTREQIRKNMLREARELVVEYNEKYALDTDSVFLWVLHKEFGFGAKRLRQVWERFFAEMDRLREHYLSKDYTDDGYLCRVGLKAIGVDVEAWYAERKK